MNTLFLVLFFLLVTAGILVVVFRDSLFGTGEEEEIPDVAVVNDYTYLPPVPMDTLPTVESEPEPEPEPESTPAPSGDFDAFSSDDLVGIESAKENLNFCLYEESAHQGMYKLVNTSDMGFNPSTEGVDSVAKIKEWAGKKFDEFGEKRKTYKSAKLGDTCDIRDSKGTKITENDGVMIYTTTGKYLTDMTVDDSNNKVRQHTQLYDKSFWKIIPVGDKVKIASYTGDTNFLTYTTADEFTTSTTATLFKVLRKGNTHAIMYDDNGEWKSLTYTNYGQKISPVAGSEPDQIKYDWMFEIKDEVQGYIKNRPLTVTAAAASTITNAGDPLKNACDNKECLGTDSIDYDCDTPYDSSTHGTTNVLCEG